MATGNMNVDWGDSGKFQRLSRKVGGPSNFSSLLKRDKSPKSGKNNNKATGFVARNGGTTSQRNIAGLNGLKKTLVDRPVNTGYMKNEQVTRGGGHPRRSIVQGKPDGVKVQPEC